MKRKTKKKRYVILFDQSSKEYTSDDPLVVKAVIDRDFRLSRDVVFIYDRDLNKIVDPKEIVNGKKLKKEIERKLRN
jgi:hypothetical protein